MVEKDLRTVADSWSSKETAKGYQTEVMGAVEHCWPLVTIN